MSDLGFTYNAADIPQEDRSYDPVPAGWYTATITNAEVKPTRDGSGEYIKCRFDITGPSHEGRVVFTNFNTRNKSDVAERIGVQQLGALMRAIGLPTLSNTDQLIGGTCSIKVSIRPADGQYEAQNEVKAFKDVNGSAPPSGVAPAPQQAAPAATPAGGTPPWQR